MQLDGVSYVLTYITYLRLKSDVQSTRIQYAKEIFIKSFGFIEYFHKVL